MHGTGVYTLKSPVAVEVKVERSDSEPAFWRTHLAHVLRVKSCDSVNDKENMFGIKAFGVIDKEKQILWYGANGTYEVKPIVMESANVRSVSVD